MACWNLANLSVSGIITPLTLNAGHFTPDWWYALIECIDSWVSESIDYSSVIRLIGWLIDVMKWVSWTLIYLDNYKVSRLFADCCTLSLILIDTSPSCNVSLSLYNLFTDRNQFLLQDIMEQNGIPGTIILFVAKRVVIYFPYWLWFHFYVISECELSRSLTELQCLRWVRW